MVLEKNKMTTTEERLISLTEEFIMRLEGIREKLRCNDIIQTYEDCGILIVAYDKYIKKIKNDKNDENIL